jgi:hypothetical protein
MSDAPWRPHFVGEADRKRIGLPCSLGVESGLGTFATRDAPESRREQEIRDNGGWAYPGRRACQAVSTWAAACKAARSAGNPCVRSMAQSCNHEATVAHSSCAGLGGGAVEGPMASA